MDRFSSAELTIESLLKQSTYLEQVLDSSSGIPHHDRDENTHDSVAAALQPRLAETLPYDSDDIQTLRKVDPDRIKWNLGPTFDAKEFLQDGHLRATFADPEFSRTHESEWPDLPKAKAHIHKADLLKLFRKWDNVGALALFPVSELDADELCGCFPVYKNTDYEPIND